MDRYSCVYGDGFMDADEEGEHVLRSEAQAEIARLQDEVERLREVTAILEDCMAKGMVIRSSKESGYSPATHLWNDAIEAAAGKTGNILIKASIRALRKP